MQRGKGERYGRPTAGRLRPLSPRLAPESLPSSTTHNKGAMGKERLTCLRGLPLCHFLDLLSLALARSLYPRALKPPTAPAPGSTDIAVMELYTMAAIVGLAVMAVCLAAYRAVVHLAPADDRDGAKADATATTTSAMSSWPFWYQRLEECAAPGGGGGGGDGSADTLEAGGMGLAPTSALSAGAQASSEEAADQPRPPRHANLPPGAEIGGGGTAAAAAPGAATPAPAPAHATPSPTGG